MAQLTISVGRVANDGTGDSLRDAFGKVNENFDELYAGRRRTVTTATYTILAADEGLNLVFTNGGGCVVTVPAGLGETFECDFTAAGNDTLLVIESGTLVSSANGGLEMMRKSGARLVAYAANEFVLWGTAIIEPGS